MKQVYISITHYGLHTLEPHVFFTEGDNEYCDLSYEEGMRQLRLLEKALGRCAQLQINQFDPTICTKVLYGWV